MTHQSLVFDSRFSGRNLSSFDHNLVRPRHRWYEFKEGFSEELVLEAISSAVSGVRKPKELKILDPFAGSGTTLVTGAKQGFSCTGIEVNPFLAFAASMKCSEQGELDIAEAGRKVLLGSRRERISNLEQISTFCESEDKEKWLFNRSVLRGFSAACIALQAQDCFETPLRLAALTALMDCSNARRDGKCLRYKPNWAALGYTSADFRKAFASRLGIVAEDVRSVPIDKASVNVINSDCREALKKIESDSVGLVVTSPPYLNSFDYSDVYRPELFAGGFVSSNRELMDVRLRTLRSHVQAQWPPSEVIATPLLMPLLDRMNAANGLWSKRIPAMVQSYFADMLAVLEGLHRALCKKGQIWLVVSTSAYGGIEIPVDLLIADCGVRVGLGLRGVFVLRSLRAAGQHWTHLAPGAKPPLRESLIIFEK